MNNLRILIIDNSRNSMFEGKCISNTDAYRYSYDASGNLIGDNAEQLIIDWNIKGKVTKVKDNSATISKIISFEYDANNNRVKKKVNITMPTYSVIADKGTLFAT